jgi:hypothetical protein
MGMRISPPTSSRFRVLVVILCSGVLLPTIRVESVGATTPSSTGVLDPASRTPWVVQENQRPGTSAWRIAGDVPDTIEGYANRVSAKVGDVVDLFVSTRKRRFHVEAYRMGYYQGFGGRLVWTSGSVRGRRQRRPTLGQHTNMIECRWSRSLRLSVGPSWVQGVYLLKLVASDGGASYIPLTVRNDTSHAALVVQAEVTTWQAYNKWGGYSLYEGPDGSFRRRSRVVSFDRPYATPRGAPLHELPMIFLVERLGLDVTYWTDVDLHERPGLLLHHRALISPNHDEYWSSTMRTGALRARDHGVNIAFFGANADYRHVRFTSSRLGQDRHMICYKVAKEDPLYGVRDREVTSNWRAQPVPRPESVLNGGLYQCNPVQGPLTVTEPGAWIYEGTGIHDNERIADLVNLEYDRVAPAYPTPKTIQILARSPLRCHGHRDVAEITYYTTSSDAGVIDVGTLGWTKFIACGFVKRSLGCSSRVLRITRNILEAFAEGPAGRDHPSEPNLARYGIRLKQPIAI